MKKAYLEFRKCFENTIYGISVRRSKIKIKYIHSEREICE